MTQSMKDNIVKALYDKGLTFVVMGFCIWIMYNWVEQGRKEDREQIKELRGLVEDCARAKKDQLELDVQAINSKVDKILTNQNID